MINIHFIYQFSEISLDGYIDSYRERSKEESIGLVHAVCDCLIEVCIFLQKNGQQLGYLCFDSKYISIPNEGRINFSYFPFNFINTYKQSNNLLGRIYSIKDLQLINENEKSKEIELLFMKNRNNIHIQKEQMLQKIALLLIKLMLLICQQIRLRQNQIQLYVMNKQFQIDYNWQLIYRLLQECNQKSQYKIIAKIIECMLQNQKKDGFLSYRRNYTEYSDEKQSLMSKREDVRSNSNSKKSNKKVNKSPNIIRKSLLSNENQSIKYLAKNINILGKKQGLQKLISSLPNKAEIIYENGKYVGQIKNGKRQGMGLYYFKQGQIYGGQWKNDEMYAQKQLYEGNVDCGIRSGFGCYYYRDGNVYRGDWKQDYKQGYGQLYNYKTQQIYKGNFKNNFQEGKGIIQYENGFRFEGIFCKGMKQGEGNIFNIKNELIIKGLWQKDEICGKIQIYYENGDYYFGQMKDGMMNGIGLYRYKCGTIYEGNFENNKMSGSCKIEYQNGDRYDGNIINNKFNHDGKYYYNRQQLQQRCDWKQGQQNGQIEFIYYNKRYKCGMNDGKLIQKIKLVNDN